MPRLFIFAIGGTGARVVRSLTMLLASGVELPGFEVVPILIDPDQANGDLNRTAGLLSNYQRVRNELEGGADFFFKNQISTLSSLNPATSQQFNNQGFNFTVIGSKTTFGNFIGYGAMSPENKALIDLLYSSSNLQDQMEVGFKGNPHVGSIVLNQFETSPEFQAFATVFQTGDRVFIVSSIFGGTGASGFPLLLKNIRGATPPMPQHTLLNDAPVGALTVLPYFALNQDNKGINSNTFISKTKAALAYYDLNVTQTSALNALYSIGDSNGPVYANNVGGGAQQNKAHFIELAGALSIVDFARLPAGQVAVRNGQAQSPMHKEFGVQANADPLSFSDLGAATSTVLKKPLSQYKYFVNYLREELAQAVGKVGSFTNGTPINNGFLASTFYNDLRNFNQTFDSWLDELESNNIGFKPFEQTNPNTVFTLLRNQPPHTVSVIDRVRGNTNYVYFNKMLDANADTQIRNLPAPQKLMRLFARTTDAFIH